MGHLRPHYINRLQEWPVKWWPIYVNHECNGETLTGEGVLILGWWILEPLFWGCCCCSALIIVPRQRCMITSNTASSLRGRRWAKTLNAPGSLYPLSSSPHELPGPEVATKRSRLHLFRRCRPIQRPSKVAQRWSNIVHNELASSIQSRHPIIPRLVIADCCI